MFDLPQLHNIHAAAIGRQLARGVLLEGNQQLLGRGCCERGVELFFEHSKRSLQRLQIGRISTAYLCCQLSEPSCCGTTCLRCNPRSVEDRGGRIEVRGQRIQVWVDDRQIADVTDEKMDEPIGGQTLDHGGVAFVGEFDAMIWIKNFSATRL